MVAIVVIVALVAMGGIWAWLHDRPHMPEALSEKQALANAAPLSLAISNLAPIAPPEAEREPDL